MDDDRRYQHFLQRDPAYDGKFLTGVLTTGIYCLALMPGPAAEARKRTVLPHSRRGPPQWAASVPPLPSGLVLPGRGMVRKPLRADGRAGAPRARRRFRILRQSEPPRASAVRRSTIYSASTGTNRPAAFLRRIRVEHVCRLLEARNQAGGCRRKRRVRRHIRVSPAVSGTHRD